MDVLDLLDFKLTRLPLEALGWIEEAGVEVPLWIESRVEEDLFVPLDSELLDSSLLSTILNVDFLRLKSLRNGILAICCICRSNINGWWDTIQRVDWGHMSGVDLWPGQSYCP